MALRLLLETHFKLVWAVVDKWFSDGLWMLILNVAKLLSDPELPHSFPELSQSWPESELPRGGGLPRRDSSAVETKRQQATLKQAHDASGKMCPGDKTMASKTEASNAPDSSKIVFIDDGQRGLV